MMNNGALKATSPAEREIVLTRVFDAPRRLVFDAMTKPELLAQWLGLPGWSLVICDAAPKAGGTWRFVLRGPDGIASMPGRLPDSLDVFPGESRVTGALVEHGGKTTLTVAICYRPRHIDDAQTADWVPGDPNNAPTYSRSTAG
jgi:uncharacterized protein YndB with AHSA1/START domain